MCVISVLSIWFRVTGPFTTRRGPAPGGFELRRQFQTPQRVGPHVLERFPDRSEHLGPGAVEPVLLIGPAHDEAGVLKRSQLQRDGAERDVGHGGRDVAGSHLMGPYQPEDLAPARGSDRGQYRVVHPVAIFRLN